MTARPPIAQFGDAIEVTQDDRDAAKALLDVLHLHEHATGTFRSWDDAVSAFARHRTSTALPLAHPAALSEPETQTALGDLPSRIQGWIGKAKNRGSDRIELDFATVELLVRLARLAHPAAPQGEEGGKFASWDAATLAAQCRMQARDSLDPEYTEFMHAVAAALAPAAIASGREGAE